MKQNSELDKKLYIKFMNGDEESFNSIVVKYRSTLVSFVYKIINDFDIAEDISHYDYLKRMCNDGLKRRYGTPSDEAIERLNYELDVIEKMGYVTYYLIVYDFIRFAKENNIPVGPGRGSGAGSLVAFLVGITDVDPMKFDLLFLR